jgi:dipeptidase D
VLSVGQARPGWQPNLDSPTLTVTRRVYERLFGEPPNVTTVQAWLDTAVIGDRAAGLDMDALGPQI